MVPVKVDKAVSCGPLLAVPSAFRLYSDPETCKRHCILRGHLLLAVLVCCYGYVLSAADAAHAPPVPVEVVHGLLLEQLSRKYQTISTTDFSVNRLADCNGCVPLAGYNITGQ